MSDEFFEIICAVHNICLARRIGPIAASLAQNLHIKPEKLRRRGRPVCKSAPYKNRMEKRSPSVWAFPPHLPRTLMQDSWWLCPQSPKASGCVVPFIRGTVDASRPTGPAFAPTRAGDKMMSVTPSAPMDPVGACAAGGPIDI